MENHQIHITENGTTTLATAGKYCDRDVDVNVSVAHQPTSFTNLVTADTTVMLDNWRIASGPSLSGASNVRLIAIANPKEGQAFRLYFRGATQISGYTNFAAGTASNKPTVMIHADTAAFCALNAQGDCYFEVSEEQSLAWIFFGYRKTKNDETVIVTIDEFIGNGGYVGE